MRHCLPLLLLLLLQPSVKRHAGVKCKDRLNIILVYSQAQIGRGHVYIEYTQKVLKIMRLGTPKKYCAGKCEFIFFSGNFFFVKQKWSLRAVVKITCLCATPVGTYLPEGNLVVGVDTWSIFSPVSEHTASKESIKYRLKPGMTADHPTCTHIQQGHPDMLYI